MARNDSDKRKSGGVQVADPPAAEAQPESLDKVRDILFGGQMRAVETRLQGLEERLRREHEALRSDFAKQVESLDAFIRSEAQMLAERLAAERTKRTEELKSLAAEIKEAIRALEKRHRQAGGGHQHGRRRPPRPAPAPVEGGLHRARQAGATAWRPS